MAVSFSNTATPAANNDFSGSSITFSSVALGAAASDRLIFVSIFHYAGGIQKVGTVTIGGINATKDAASYITDGSGGELGWWWAAVPTGTTGNIVIPLTGSASDDSAIITVYRVTGADTSTPITSSVGQSDTTNTVNTGTAVVIPANGAMLISSSCYKLGGSPVFSSWTNATNDGGANWSNLFGWGGKLESGNSSSSGSAIRTATFATGGIITISAIAIQAGTPIVGDGSLMFTQALRW